MSNIKMNDITPNKRHSLVAFRAAFERLGVNVGIVRGIVNNMDVIAMSQTDTQQLHTFMLSSFATRFCTLLSKQGVIEVMTEVALLVSAFGMGPPSVKWFVVQHALGPERRAALEKATAEIVADFRAMYSFVARFVPDAA